MSWPAYEPAGSVNRGQVELGKARLVPGLYRLCAVNWVEAAPKSGQKLPKSKKVLPGLNCFILNNIVEQHIIHYTSSLSVELLYYNFFPMLLWVNNTITIWRIQLLMNNHCKLGALCVGNMRSSIPTQLTRLQYLYNCRILVHFNSCLYLRWLICCPQVALGGKSC